MHLKRSRTGSHHNRVVDRVGVSEIIKRMLNGPELKTIVIGIQSLFEGNWFTFDYN